MQHNNQHPHGGAMQPQHAQARPGGGQYPQQMPRQPPPPGTAVGQSRGGPPTPGRSQHGHPVSSFQTGGPSGLGAVNPQHDVQDYGTYEQQQDQYQDEAQVQQSGPEGSSLGYGGEPLNARDVSTFNGAPRPPPQAPVAFAFGGIQEYTAYPPGFESPGKWIYFEEWIPHIPYMSYQHPPGFNGFGGKTVQKSICKGCEKGNVYKMTAPGERGMYARWGAERAKNRKGEFIGDPYDREIVISLEDPQHVKFVQDIDFKNKEVGRARYDHWFNEGKDRSDPDSLFDVRTVMHLYKSSFKKGKPKDAEDPSKGNYLPTWKIKVKLPKPEEPHENQRGGGEIAPDGSSKKKTPVRRPTMVYRAHGLIKNGSGAMVWDCEEAHWSELEREHLRLDVVVRDSGLYFISGTGWGNSFKAVRLIILPSSEYQQAGASDDICVRPKTKDVVDEVQPGPYVDQNASDTQGGYGDQGWDGSGNGGDSEMYDRAGYEGGGYDGSNSGYGDQGGYNDYDNQAV